MPPTFVTGPLVHVELSFFSPRPEFDVQASDSTTTDVGPPGANVRLSRFATYGWSAYGSVDRRTNTSCVPCTVSGRTTVAVPSAVQLDPVVGSGTVTNGSPGFAGSNASRYTDSAELFPDRLELCT
ncbi:Uncharacterised protein [Mycobacteroides abscessus]|nr:Uncharacterised protein [Mycobacteroides abscessus]